MGGQIQVDLFAEGYPHDDGGDTRLLRPSVRRAGVGEADTDSAKEECSTDGDGGGEGADVGGEGADDDGAESKDGDAGVLTKATDAPAADVNEAAAALPRPRTVADNRKVSPQSLHPRHLVPPAMAQKKLAAILEALRDPSVVVKYLAASHFHHCGSCRVRGTCKIKRAADPECGAGVASATVTFWSCHTCKTRVMPDGRDRGVVSLSTKMIYSEFCLFENSVSLSRNGCSLWSSAQLRDAFYALSAPHIYPHLTKKLVSVSRLRKAVILYLSLVIKRVPLAVTQCFKCRRPDGSHAVVCFDGLQLGYRVKYKMPFKKTSAKVGAIARASVHARVIQYE